MSQQQAVLIGCDENVWQQWLTLLQSDTRVTIERVASIDSGIDATTISGGAAGVRFSLINTQFEIMGNLRKESQRVHINDEYCLLVLWTNRTGSHNRTCNRDVIEVVQRYVTIGGTLYLPFKAHGNRGYRPVTIVEFERLFTRQ